MMAGPDCNEQEFYDIRETSSDVIEELIVGRTDEKEKIMTSLLQGDSMRDSITTGDLPPEVVRKKKEIASPSFLYMVLEALARQHLQK